MFIAYFVLFVVFNGKLTLETAVFGLVFAAALYAFCCKFLGYSIKKDFRLVCGTGEGLRYLFTLAGEIVKANFRVIRMILSRNFEPEPQLIQFHAGLKEDGHRVALADSITLTPGTITCDLEGDLFTVHCLDRIQREGIENSYFLMTLKDMEFRAEMREAASKLKKGIVSSDEASVPAASVVHNEERGRPEEAPQNCQMEFICTEGKATNDGNTSVLEDRSVSSVGNDTDKQNMPVVDEETVYTDENVSVKSGVIDQNESAGVNEPLKASETGKIVTMMDEEGTL